ncbi:CLUMA_CG001263, isoform A [Clunio marinus]|uniref:Ubiquitin carboxyl-terminal hydrolase 7 n=1 Tax=Clunio marinus TaxID=568069 RepID=A0A1J1HLY9_9DIPT|nr:CLUMA_CG001263, isoform A [Clunio marinus]
MSLIKLEKSETVVKQDENWDQNVGNKLQSEATFQLKIVNFSKVTKDIFSDEHYVRGLLWKIKAKTDYDSKTLRFHLCCEPDIDSNTFRDDLNWNCSATVDLRMISFKENVKNMSKTYHCTFSNISASWGYSSYHILTDILDPDQGYVKDDTVILEAHIQAHAPYNANWDSKKMTGYVGLKKNEKTCYMNSVLQTLFFINEFKQKVHEIPTKIDDVNNSVALALQRIFHDLEFSSKPVGTKKFIKSLGWDQDLYAQDGAHAFLHVLLEKLQTKMKGSSYEGTIDKLFAGKTISYITHKNLTYVGTKMETFFSIQLKVKGMANLTNSLNDYISTKIINFDSDKAEKRVIFTSFPTILHFHLLRFEYDPIAEESVKCNDVFKFYENLDLNKFLKKAKNTPVKYVLYAVLSHSDSEHDGHYAAFINPKLDGNWFKFHDDVVSDVAKSSAIDYNYGDNREFTNAYMLVYVRESIVN